MDTLVRPRFTETGNRVYMLFLPHEFASRPLTLQRMPKIVPSGQVETKKWTPDFEIGGYGPGTDITQVILRSLSNCSMFH